MKTENNHTARFSITQFEDYKVHLVGEKDEARGEVEKFARDCYRKAYGAELKTFCKELLILRSPSGSIVSCVGLNMPSEGGLFLEQYLDEPVEDEISKIAGKRVERNGVAEIGTMAIGHKGFCRLMMLALAVLLRSRGIEFLAFTAVKSLRNSLDHLGVPYRSIKKATPDRLTGDKESWGSYYESFPEVSIIDLNEGLRYVEGMLKGSTEFQAISISLLLRRTVSKIFPGIRGENRACAVK